MTDGIVPKIFSLLNALLVKIIYRVRVFNADRLPKSGGALLVANHVAWSDPPLLHSACPRPIRFLMYRPFYELPILGYVAKLFRAIPISHKDGPRELMRSLGQARSAIEEGNVVGLFAEGQLTRIGNLLPFGKGLEKIMKGVNAPIIPCYIDEIWGSFFSFRGGRPVRKLPRKFPYPVSIWIGEALPGDTKAWKVRRAVQELGEAAFSSRVAREPGLGLTLLRALRKKPWREAVKDSSGLSLSRWSFLCASLRLSGILIAQGKSTSVGILLPPSVAGALVNVACVLAGKTPVNLNYSLAQETYNSTCQQSKVDCIITSKSFVEKIPIKPEVKALYVEDFLGSKGRLVSLLKAIAFLLLPTAYTAEKIGVKIQTSSDIATILFSSGSTSTPKGILLSHGNIASNVLGLADVLHLTSSDCLLGSLPFFHSFGLTATLWLPLLSGLKVVFHPQPLDGAAVGKLVQSEKSTILLSTPTFLQMYVRKCDSSHFATLRLVVVGAEKLKQALVESFKDKFGIVPLEGYGCTELSPIVAVSLPNYSDDDVLQSGSKVGSVGHPLPGISTKVVDPENFIELPPNQEGLLLIRGPNVMLGYLDNLSATKDVLRDGWYITGDIGKVDEDGFIYITDRLSRFSKIGGEMIPHLKVEEELHLALGINEQVFVVTSLSHDRKGEQLAVLHTIEIEPTEVIAKLTASGLPNLWIPKRNAFIKIDMIPLLGSGKLDLREVRRIAREKMSVQE